jgi:chromatin remodeling complex protein RSC6
MATAKKAAATSQDAEVTPKTPAKKAAAAPVPAEAPAATEAPAKKRSSKMAEETAPTKGFMKALTPSKELAAVVGKKALPRTEVTKKLWEYIKKHKLQDETKRTVINADAKLKAVFGQDQVTMFEMAKLISPHLKG